MEVADMNLDGREDVILGSNVALQGKAGLSSPLYFEAAYKTHSHPKALDIGDLNTDGRPDIATVGSRSSSVLLQYSDLKDTTTSFSSLRKSNSSVKIKGNISLKEEGHVVSLSLLRKGRYGFVKLLSRKVRTDYLGAFLGSFPRTRSGECLATASFGGSSTHSRSFARKYFPC